MSISERDWSVGLHQFWDFLASFSILVCNMNARASERTHVTNTVSAGTKVLCVYVFGHFPTQPFPHMERSRDMQVRVPTYIQGNPEPHRSNSCNWKILHWVLRSRLTRELSGSSYAFGLGKYPLLLLREIKLLFLSFISISSNQAILSDGMREYVPAPWHVFLSSEPPDFRRARHLSSELDVLQIISLN